MVAPTSSRRPDVFSIVRASRDVEAVRGAKVGLDYYRDGAPSAGQVFEAELRRHGWFQR
jgi:hypothetical protein